MGLQLTLSIQVCCTMLETTTNWFSPLTKKTLISVTQKFLPSLSEVSNKHKEKSCFIAIETNMESVLAKNFF